jgi:hypothetical protein
MKKRIFIFFIVLMNVISLSAQALEHTQGEILIQVRNEPDLKKIISNITR